MAIVNVFISYLQFRETGVIGGELLDKLIMPSSSRA